MTFIYKARAMERLRYSATDSNKIQEQGPLFSYWMIFTVLCAVIFIFYFLFPGKTLVNTLLHQATISEVDLSYSLLLRKNNEGITITKINKDPLEVIQKLQQSLQDSNQTMDDLWFNYIILRAIAYNPQQSTAIRQQAIASMLLYFDVFKQLDYSEQQIDQSARDAVAIEKAPYALYFYEKLISLNPERSAAFYLNTAKVALWANQCVKSADYYFITQHKSVSIADKRLYYLHALKILFQCEQSALAISLADKNLDGLSDDIPTYQALIDLAIKGDQPAVAQKYLFQLLLLKNAAVK